MAISRQIALRWLDAFQGIVCYQTETKCINTLKPMVSLDHSYNMSIKKEKVKKVKKNDWYVRTSTEEYKILDVHSED